MNNYSIECPECHHVGETEKLCWYCEQPHNDRGMRCSVEVKMSCGIVELSLSAQDGQRDDGKQLCKKCREKIMYRAALAIM